MERNQNNLFYHLNSQRDGAPVEGDWNYGVVGCVLGGGECVTCVTSGGCVLAGGSVMLPRTYCSGWCGGGGASHYHMYSLV
jgi:hypothetical protein